MKINKLFEKEIISMNDGSRLGELYDLEIDEYTGQIKEIVVIGKLHFFSFIIKKEKINIPWNNVRVIGDETILVDCELSNDSLKRNGLLNTFFD